MMWQNNKVSFGVLKWHFFVTSATDALSRHFAKMLNLLPKYSKSGLH